MPPRKGCEHASSENDGTAPPQKVRVSFTWCSGMDINPWMGNIQYINIYIYRDSHEGWMTVQHLPCFDHVTDECTSSKTSQEVLFYTNVLVTRCDTILWVGYNFCTRHNLSSYLHFSGYIFMFLGIWLMGILTWVEWVFEAERIPAACGRLQGLESVGHVLQNINVCLQLDMYIIYNIYIYIYIFGSAVTPVLYDHFLILVCQILQNPCPLGSASVLLASNGLPCRCLFLHLEYRVRDRCNTCNIIIWASHITWYISWLPRIEQVRFLLPLSRMLSLRHGCIMIADA